MRSLLFEELLSRYPALKACEESLEIAGNMIPTAYSNGGKVYICGNGGSAADGEHIVGELMKSFKLPRPMLEEKRAAFRESFGEDADEIIGKLQEGIPAFSLNCQAGVISAFANDVDSDLIYAQQLFASARKNDLLICISTSGNAENVALAAKCARAIGVRTLALTGCRDSKLSQICDCTVKVPETETFKVQELHLPVYHWLCAEAEKRIFG